MLQSLGIGHAEGSEPAGILFPSGNPPASVRIRAALRGAGFRSAKTATCIGGVRLRLAVAVFASGRGVLNGKFSRSPNNFTSGGVDGGVHPFASERGTGVGRSPTRNPPPPLDARAPVSWAVPISGHGPIPLGIAARTISNIGTVPLACLPFARELPAVSGRNGLPARAARQVCIAVRPTTPGIRATTPRTPPARSRNGTPQDTRGGVILKNDSALSNRMDTVSKLKTPG